MAGNFLGMMWNTGGLPESIRFNKAKMVCT